ncbi:hypothetical protein INT48_002501 [Thamnidium elegans]|uniref:Acetyl-CoA synthetase-like protein n=1 Tax=Thamnidium elegans TaxID=101142 RepID=A0A8H7SX04_9FUNG|nr:hypothetical protein INT48_002501 [Thamnidium elegans]
MIIESLKPKSPIPDVTVYQFLFKDNHRLVDRNKPCYIDAEDSTKFISFADFENLILRFAAGLKFNFPDFALGDVVAMYSPSDIYFSAVAHGSVVAGGAFAAIDHSCNSELAADCLQTVKAKIIVAHAETLTRAKEAAQFVGIPVKNIFVLGEEDIDGTLSIHNAMWNHHHLATPVKLTKEQISTIPCYFYYTSGTTGKKKAVATTQSNMISWLSSMPEWYPTETLFLSHTEPHHGSALIFAMHLHIMHNYTTYILTKFTFESLQPWMAAVISKEESIVSQYDISSVRFAHCSGSPVSHVGTLSPNFCCKLINDEGNEVGYDEVGELCIKEPTQKLGYYNNTKANGESFDEDGYFHTGDLFQVNEKGIFTHIDRINDVIKYKYNKIAPQEIEDVLMTHPLVVGAAVVGALSEEEGVYLIRAFVVLKKSDQDIEQSKQEIIDITKAQLSDLKQLRGGLYVLDDLPRNNTGKINRRALRQYNVDNLR